MICITSLITGPQDPCTICLKKRNVREKQSNRRTPLQTSRESPKIFQCFFTRGISCGHIRLVTRRMAGAHIRPVLQYLRYPLVHLRLQDLPRRVSVRSEFDRFGLRSQVSLRRALLKLRARKPLSTHGGASRRAASIFQYASMAFLYRAQVEQYPDFSLPCTTSLPSES